MPAKLTANRGASLSRQSIVAKLRRDRKLYADVLGGESAFDYIGDLIEWVNRQSLRASQRKGGLGKRGA